MTEKKKEMPTPAEEAEAFEAKLEVVFMVLEDRQERGAKAWLARLCEVNPSTVSRWVGGDTPIPGPVKALLRELEFRASVATLLSEERLRGPW